MLPAATRRPAAARTASSFEAGVAPRRTVSAVSGIMRVLRYSGRLGVRWRSRPQHPGAGGGEGIGGVGGEAVVGDQRVHVAEVGEAGEAVLVELVAVGEDDRAP